MGVNAKIICVEINIAVVPSWVKNVEVTVNVSIAKTTDL
jgi:hypothetical protein